MNQARCLKLTVIVDSSGLLAYGDRVSDQELDRQVRHRLAVLRHAEEVTGSVAMTSRYFGISRQTFYKWQQRYHAVMEVLSGARVTEVAQWDSVRGPLPPGRVGVVAVGVLCTDGAVEVSDGVLDRRGVSSPCVDQWPVAEPLCLQYGLRDGCLRLWTSRRRLRCRSSHRLWPELPPSNINEASATSWGHSPRIPVFRLPGQNEPQLFSRLGSGTS